MPLPGVSSPLLPGVSSPPLPAVSSPFSTGTAPFSEPEEAPACALVPSAFKEDSVVASFGGTCEGCQQVSGSCFGHGRSTSLAIIASKLTRRCTPSQLMSECTGCVEKVLSSSSCI
eukprot:6214359-Pleurochrysis_carterae.AAC.4